MRVTLLPQEGAGHRWGAWPPRGSWEPVYSQWGTRCAARCLSMDGSGPASSAAAGEQSLQRRPHSLAPWLCVGSGCWVPQGQVSTVVSWEQLELSPVACERQH